MDKLVKIAASHSSYIKEHLKYRMIQWDRFDYSILTKNIMYYKKKGKYQTVTWNDIIIGSDTETSKHHFHTVDVLTNYICSWNISLALTQQEVLMPLYFLKNQQFCAINLF